MYNYSTYRTNRVPTRSVRQVRVYAFGAPTTCLRVWCTYEALTNQGEDASVYRPRSLLYTIDSHHPNKHMILHVFRARGYDSLVLLSQYEHNTYNAISYKFSTNLNCFGPLAKGGGTIIELAQLQQKCLSKTLNR